jgi:hypothetical protein
LPAIISVFFWTVSISYLVLSIVLDETRKDEPLVFKDQDLVILSILVIMFNFSISETADHTTYIKPKMVYPLEILLKKHDPPGFSTM